MVQCSSSHGNKLIHVKLQQHLRFSAFKLTDGTIANVTSHSSATLPPSTIIMQRGVSPCASMVALAAKTVRVQLFTRCTALSSGSGSSSEHVVMAARGPTATPSALAIAFSNSAIAGLILLPADRLHEDGD